MLLATVPYCRELADGLVLRSVANSEDLDRVAGFNGAVHGPEVAGMTRELLMHHPNTRPEYCLFVEDTATRKVVSSICLIPWTWQYEDVELKAGEMGIVGTLEGYRRRGLIRTQVTRHAELLREGGYDLGHIQGIPYFYRQFGYEYAIPLEGGWRFDLHLMPERSVGRQQPAFSMRPATLDDVHTLMRLYDEAAGDLTIHTVRDEAIWRYLLGPSLRTDTSAETWLIEDARGAAQGYLRIPKLGFGEGLIVNEASRLTAPLATFALSQVRELARQRSKPYVRICMAAGNTLVSIARHHGAHSLGTYAWQIALPDVGRLLWKLAPVLERRVASSPLAGLTQDVCLSLYRQAYALRFQRGRLTAVDPLGSSDRGDIRLPPLLTAPLLLGYRCWDELAQAHHDMSVRDDCRYLVDVLFPKVPSFIYTIY